jgi:hypothetical protein
MNSSTPKIEPIDPGEIYEQSTPFYLTDLIASVAVGAQRVMDVELPDYARMVMKFERLRWLQLKEADELLAGLPPATQRDVEDWATVEVIAYSLNLKLDGAAERFYSMGEVLTGNLEHYRTCISTRFSGLADLLWRRYHAHLLPEETDFQTYEFFLGRWFLRSQTKHQVLMRNLELLAAGQLLPEYQLLTLGLVDFDDEAGVEAALSAFRQFEPGVREGYLDKLREKAEFKDYLEAGSQLKDLEYSSAPLRSLLMRFEELA